MKHIATVTLFILVSSINFAFGAESRSVLKFITFEGFNIYTKQEYNEYITEESFRELTDADLASLMEPYLLKSLINIEGEFESNELADKIPLQNISALETRFIGQKEFSISGANDEKHKLATTGVGPCVAIGIYHPILKRALLAHCDYATHVASMNLLIFAAFGNTIEKQARFFLISQSNDNALRFHSYLKSLGFPDTAFTIIITNSSSNVGLDAQDGTFFHYHYNHEIHKDNMLEDRQKVVGQNMTKNTLDFIK